MFWYFKKR